MSAEQLAKSLAEAVAKDEAPDVGGFDLSAGLFGPNVSQWVRSLTAPVPMILFCPACGTQHIDAAELPEEQDRNTWWTNPPHRSHLCHSCRCVWRPADVATVGVAQIQTKGKADTWRGPSAMSPEPEERVEALVRIDILVDEIESLCEKFDLDPIQWLSDGWQDRP